MTDNEKRAHDLAVALCVDICHVKAKAQIVTGKEDIDVDCFSEYIFAYNAALEEMNKNFPEGK